MNKPDLGPDVPWTPLPAGSLQAAIADADPDYRRELRAKRLPDDTPIRSRALGLLADNLDRLEAIVSDERSTAAEVTAAMAQLARIADAYSADSPTALSARPLCTLTHAELMQRVAEIDTRREQLLAAIARAG